MKILLIACSYPPDPVVGSFRAAKLAKAFRDAGHDVDVVTSRLPGEAGALRINEPKLRVHTVRELPGPLAAYRWLKKTITGTRSTQRGQGLEARGTPELPDWKRVLLSAVWVPDSRKGFVGPAMRRSRRIARQGIDMVYTTAPPFSSHLVGLGMKWLAGLPWVAEFRDPWTENANRRYRSAGADAVNAWLERTCLKHADKLVAVSEGIRDLLLAKLPAARRGDVLLALNGIDNLVSADHEEVLTGTPFRIAHLGNCYSGRDPRPFLYALAKIMRRKGLTARDVQVDFIGDCRNYEGESLEQLVEAVGLSGCVSFVEWIPQEEARAQARAADLFLLPFPKLGLIPNKLYDYLGLRRPILAFVHPDGETARLLRRVGGHYLITDDDIETAERVLESALFDRGEHARSTQAEAVLSELTTERQLGNLLHALLPGQAARPARSRSVSSVS